MLDLYDDTTALRVDFVQSVAPGVSRGYYDLVHTYIRGVLYSIRITFSTPDIPHKEEMVSCGSRHMKGWGEHVTATTSGCVPGHTSIQEVVAGQGILYTVLLSRRRPGRGRGAGDLFRRTKRTELCKG